MQNVHPIIAQALNPFAPPRSQSIFDVRINLAGDERSIAILAPSSCSAICRATELLLDDNDDIPADGLMIVCRPRVQS